MSSRAAVRDLVVVGGGPVGLAAAVEAALAGLDVLVVEPRTGPVDKACGEGLMPGALTAVQRLGVDPPGAAFTGITYVGPDGERTAAHDFRDGPGRGVRRTVLQAALAERARALGVPVQVGRVRALDQDGAGVRLRLAGQEPGRTSEVRARWVLGCDGLHSTVRRLAGLDAGSDGRRYGVRRHAALAPWSPHVEVHWGRRAEAYVTPVGPGEVGVAVEGGRGTGFEQALAELPALRERLAGAAWTTAARGAGPLRQRVRARASGRVLLAGDAAGYVDALTGEGLRVGLAAARAAVEAVAGGTASELADRGPARAGVVARVGAGYERAWRELSRDYRVLTTGLVVATRAPVVRAGLVPFAASVPGLFAGAVERLAR